MLLELDRTLPQLNYSTIGATKAEQVAVTWKKLQVAFPDLNGEQKSVFNTMIGAVQPALTWEIVEH